ncbi:hypothetical protein FS837_005448 [Tulasnella sp. UAMH 9824]|nr:hypothetical protein FS837_005448 [Tulasnella sp. UAMH 9824]
MPSENEDETLRKAERLIAEYRNASSDLDKFYKLEGFMKLWNYPEVDIDNSPGILRAMRHAGLLPLILKAMTASVPVAISVATLQILMLNQLRILLDCCSAETPNPWPMHFRQFEHLLPDAFNRSLEMIEERSEEHYIPPLRLAVLKTVARAFDFLKSLDGNTAL